MAKVLIRVILHDCRTTPENTLLSCILFCVYHCFNVSCVMSADNGMVVMLTVIVLHKLSVGHTTTTTIDCIEWILLGHIEIKLNG